MTSYLKVVKTYFGVLLVFIAGIHVWFFASSYYNQKPPLPYRRLAKELNNAMYLRVNKDGQNESKPISLRELGPLKSKTKLLKMELSNHRKTPWSEFRYPLNIDMVELVRKLRSNIPVEHQPVFVYRYNFTNYRVDKCVDGSPFFIFLIKSAVYNTKHRAAIRETWASSYLIERHNGVRLFLVGASDKQSVRSAVEDENNLHKDMIIMSFRDNYYNNTLKTIGAIHWTVKHCNRSKFVVFVDDDMLVSTTRLVDFLKVNVTLTNFFGGFVARNAPQRFKQSKWYVSHRDYPYDVYPPMPSAGFMIMTMDFVVDLHFASPYTKNFIFDDCYLGLLAYKLHVTPVIIKSVYMFIHIDTRSKLFNTQLLAAHDFPPAKLKSLWSALQEKFISKT